MPSDTCSKLDVSFFLDGPMAPATRFRVLQYLNRYPEEIRSVIYHTDFLKGDQFLRKGRNGMRALKFARKIVHSDGSSRSVIQRMLIYRNNVSLEKLILRKSKNGIVIDFDDAIFLENPKFAYTIAASDLVIAGNGFLAQWASNFSNNIKIIPTSIDINKFTPRPRDCISARKLRVGWTGTKGNLCYLQNIEPSIRKLQKKHRFSFFLISDIDVPPAFLSGLDLELVRWDIRNEVKQLWAIDIGLMPLPDNDWARGKCGLKLLQYMATGSVAIGARIGANCEVIDDGENGFLYRNLTEFEEKLDFIITNYHRMELMKKNARKKVIKRFSIQNNRYAFFKGIMNLE